MKKLKQYHLIWLISAIALASILFSCRPTKGVVTHFKKIHPKGMWTGKGYFRPNVDSILLTLKNEKNVQTKSADKNN